MAQEVSKDTRTVVPACNICESDGTMVMKLEMPGVNKSGLDVNIDNDVLTIQGHREAPARGTYMVRERRTGDFRASYTLDERIDRDKIDANLEQGILTLTLHLKDEVKPRKITVNAG